MKLFSRSANFSVLFAGTAWFFYVLLQLQHFYDTAIKVPTTQRVNREVSELRLPRIYFCPADRGRSAGFQWHSFECTLSFKDERSECPARLQGYMGRTPEEFRGPLDGGGTVKADAGECLEFGTHRVGVREEWSAAWNEVILRAAFHPPSVRNIGDALQEIELGYLPEEWMIGSRVSTEQRYYYPMLRVPFFFLPPGNEPGVATRVFMGKEVDRDLSSAGKYWYTYGAMQIAVVNASAPKQTFSGGPYSPPERSPGLGVVHVVITLEDFEEFDVQVVSCFFPFLGFIGQISGVGALLAFIAVGPRLRTGPQASKGAGAAETITSPTGGPEYARVSREEEEGSDTEAQALLSSDATRQTRTRPEERVNQALLLNTEEGLDGL